MCFGKAPWWQEVGTGWTGGSRAGPGDGETARTQGNGSPPPWSQDWLGRALFLTDTQVFLFNAYEFFVIIFPVFGKKSKTSICVRQNYNLKTKVFCRENFGSDSLNLCP